jgi:hypothetical protein
VQWDTYIHARDGRINCFSGSRNRLFGGNEGKLWWFAQRRGVDVALELMTSAPDQAPSREADVSATAWAHTLSLALTSLGSSPVPKFRTQAHLSASTFETDFTIYTLEASILYICSNTHYNR